MNELERFWKTKSVALGSKNHLVTKILENNPLKVINDLDIDEFLSKCNDGKLKKNGRHAFLSMLKTKAKLEIERLKR